MKHYHVSNTVTSTDYNLMAASAAPAKKAKYCIVSPGNNHVATGNTPTGKCQ